MSISDTVAAGVIAKAVQHIDMDALAQRIAPKICAEIEKEIMRSFKDVDLGDLAYDILNSTAMTKLLSAKIAKAFK